MRQQTLAIMALLVLGGNATATTTEDRRSKPIKTPPIEADSLVAVQIDPDVYAASADGYGDLRIASSSGQEVPFVVRPVTTMETRGVRLSARVARPQVRPLPDDGLEITWALDSSLRGAVPESIVLATPLKDFEHCVTVAWSRDGSDWKLLVDDAVIYDYSRFMDVRDLTIPLPEPPGPGGSYRIVIDSVTQAQQARLTELTRTLVGGTEREVQERTVIDRRPFRLDGINLWYTAEVATRPAPVLATITPEDFATADEPDGRATRLTVTTRREPITEITIATPSRNFSRRVAVELPPTASRGLRRTIATAAITQIDVAGIHRKSLSIPVPESREATYEIVIDDGDSPPIEVMGVTACGPVREVVFLAEPETMYRLSYGGAASPPRYDTAAIDAAIAARMAVTPATLGDEVATAEERPTGKQMLWWLSDGRMQIAVITGLVLVLALALYGAAKRIAPINDHQSEP